MGEGPRSRSERRSHDRAHLLATAIVLRRDRPVGRYVVQNLSAGGALLTGSHPVEPGTRIRVLLRFPDQKMVTLHAKVARRSRTEGDVVSLAVTFRHRSDATQDVIQQEALAALLRSCRPSVLVISDRREVRARLAAQLEAMGRPVRAVATPLDALRWLEDPSEAIDLVVVPHSFGRPGAFALLGFLAEEYPDLRRALVPDGPSGLASTLPRGIADRGEDEVELERLLRVQS
jgi:CheY-like chemotaxis protein